MRSIILLLFVISVAVAGFAQPPTKTTLRGQMVCSVCWTETDDRKKVPYGTAADMDCALECSEMDIPQALAVEDEKGFTLYVLEPGTYKPDGKDFLALVPKMVEITGTLRTENNKRILKVDALRVLADAPPKPVPASNDASLTLRDLTGTEQSLAAYRGRVVVLNFWATWCEPCRAEMPDLAAIQNEYAALGVQVIGASSDPMSDSAKVLKFIREYKVNFPVWLGANTPDMQRFGLGEVLPATAIIDRTGKIVWREIGIIKPAELRKQLDALLLPDVEASAKEARATRRQNASLVPA